MDFPIGGKHVAVWVEQDAGVVVAPDGRGPFENRTAQKIDLVFPCLVGQALCRRPGNILGVIFVLLLGAKVGEVLRKSDDLRTSLGCMVNQLLSARYVLRFVRLGIHLDERHADFIVDHHLYDLVWDSAARTTLNSELLLRSRPESCESRDILSLSASWTRARKRSMCSCMICSAPCASSLHSISKIDRCCRKGTSRSRMCTNEYYQNRISS